MLHQSVSGLAIPVPSSADIPLPLPFLSSPAPALMLDELLLLPPEGALTLAQAPLVKTLPPAPPLSNPSAAPGGVPSRPAVEPPPVLPGHAQLVLNLVGHKLQ